MEVRRRGNEETKITRPRDGMLEGAAETLTEGVARRARKLPRVLRREARRPASKGSRQDACPADYECAPVKDGMAVRQLCLPKIKVCLDALGGFCDRVAVPQACSRTNPAGL